MLPRALQQIELADLISFGPNREKLALFSKTTCYQAFFMAPLHPWRFIKSPYFHTSCHTTHALEVHAFQWQTNIRPPY
jgi:hypothetical protein